MKKIIDCKYVEAESISRLNQKISESIQQGWETIGILIQHKTTLMTDYIQKMVKYENENLNQDSNKSINNQPFLDWQENREDNKPKIGEKVLIDLKYSGFQTDYIMEDGDWHGWANSYIKKWAYIPE